MRILWVTMWKLLMFIIVSNFDVKKYIYKKEELIYQLNQIKWYINYYLIQSCIHIYLILIEKKRTRHYTNYTQVETWY